MTSRSSRAFAIAVLLASGAVLPLPLQAAERTEPATPAATSVSPTPDGSVRIVTAANDVMVPDDEDEPEASDASGRDRGSRAASPDEDQGYGRSRDRHAHGWDETQDGSSRGANGGSGGWDRHDRMDRGWRDETPQERRRMMAMHGRMMQAQRQSAAGFRIEMGATRMAVRCSPRETMRECVDAALSLVNRLRDGDKPARPPIGPDSGAPSPTPTPSAPSQGAAPGAGSSSPQ